MKHFYIISAHAVRYFVRQICIFGNDGRYIVDIPLPLFTASSNKRTLLNSNTIRLPRDFDSKSTFKYLYLLFLLDLTIASSILSLRFSKHHSESLQLCNTTEALGMTIYLKDGSRPWSRHLR
jgi:hypothetical protein